MLRELAELGTLSVETSFDSLPAFDALETDKCFLSWSLELSGSVDEAAIKEVFDWAEGDCDLDIVEATPPAESTAASSEDHCNYDLIAEFDAMIEADAAPKYAPIVAAPSGEVSGSETDSEALKRRAAEEAATSPAAAATVGAGRGGDLARCSGNCRRSSASTRREY
jgi:two-component system chemotaxis sensor kinase CheA